MEYFIVKTKDDGVYKVEFIKRWAVHTAYVFAKCIITECLEPPKQCCVLYGDIYHERKAYKIGDVKYFDINNLTPYKG